MSVHMVRNLYLVLWGLSVTRKSDVVRAVELADMGAEYDALLPWSVNKLAVVLKLVNSWYIGLKHVVTL